MKGNVRNRINKCLLEVNKAISDSLVQLNIMNRIVLISYFLQYLHYLIILGLEL